MASSLSSWLMPLLLAAGCLAIVLNIWSARKVNKTLIEDIERANADLRIAVDASADCSKQLEGKSNDVSAKDKQIETINGQAGRTTTNERTREDRATQPLGCWKVNGLTKEKEDL